MKISKIYISPSEQEHNKYAVGNTTEEIQCNRIAEAAKIALERCGFEVKKAPQAQAMEKNIAESNSWGADIHLCIHTNAGGGSGCVVFVSKKDERHMQYAKPVYDALSAITRASETYGVRIANFTEIAKTTGLCIYVECEFHDNIVDAQWIIDHVEDIGEAICKGICDGAGVDYNEAVIIEEAVKGERWQTIDDIPKGFYRDEAQKLIDMGVIKGKGNGTLDLTEDMLRCMIFCQRIIDAKI